MIQSTAAEQLRSSKDSVSFTDNRALPQAASVAFIPELQLLRAIGCLLVFIAHVFVIIFPEFANQSADRPSGELYARAVIGFFILSGLVLSLPFVGQSPQPLRIGRFYFSRLLRLYPAYIISVLLALGLRTAIHHWGGLAGLGPWPQHFWGAPITLRSMFEHLLPFAIGVRNINPVYWTLSLELQSILLLPALIVLVKCTRHWTLGLAAIAGLTFLAHYTPEFLLVRITSYFLMGTYLAKYNRELRAFLQSLSKSITALALIALATFFFLVPSHNFSYRLSFLVLDASLAVLMIAVQTYKPLIALSALRPVQKLGALSYCFYLVHLPILVAVVWLLRPIVQSSALLIFAALTVSLLVAQTLHHFVEQPVRAFSNRYQQSKAKPAYSPRPAFPDQPTPAAAAN